MGKIHQLPEILANRIAAGEVVERPASVVKELVENSLDAGAGRIEVAIEAGGRALIRVSDDGEGMSREDLQLSVERHATSKIRNESDLEHIGTLGFRGEALPSIASVSLLQIVTSDRGDGAGWRLRVKGGIAGSVVETAAPVGTTVEVSSLFFNTPARRKFLKSIPRESTLIAETVLSLALANHECAFLLISDGRRMLDAPVARDRAERIGSLLGPEAVTVTAHGARGGMSLEAYLSGLGESRPDRSAQRLFVNGRPVRDRTVLHAISQAFGPVLPPGRYPIATLFLELPADAVDVNVHPTKSEVRFRTPGEIHRIVTSSLSTALREVGALPSAPVLDLPRIELPGGAPSRSDAAGLPLEGSGYRPVSSLAGGTGPAESRAWNGAPYAAPPAPGPRSGGSPGAQSMSAAASVIAQYRDSYIIATDGNGLVLVDQHAAHERVLFEKLLERGGEGAGAVQPFLEPLTVELSPVESAAIAGARDSLTGLGIDLEAFGDRTVLLRAMPELFSGMDPVRLFRDILRDLAADRLVIDDTEPAGADRFPGEAATAGVLRRLAASAACQAAVKVNYPLTGEKMAWLLEALSGCRVPTTCPHGRPTQVRMDHQSIEKAFLRA